MCDLQIGRDDRRIHVEKSDAQRDPLLRFLRKPIPDGTEPLFFTFVHVTELIDPSNLMPGLSDEPHRRQDRHADDVETRLLLHHSRILASWAFIAPLLCKERISFSIPEAAGDRHLNLGVDTEKSYSLSTRRDGFPAHSFMTLAFGLGPGLTCLTSMDSGRQKDFKIRRPVPMPTIDWSKGMFLIPRASLRSLSACSAMPLSKSASARTTTTI
jgi:hypothetical protein